MRGVGCNLAEVQTLGRFECQTVYSTRHDDLRQVERPRPDDEQSLLFVVLPRVARQYVVQVACVGDSREYRDSGQIAWQRLIPHFGGDEVQSLSIGVLAQH